MFGFLYKLELTILKMIGEGLPENTKRIFTRNDSTDNGKNIRYQDTELQTIPPT